MRPFQITIKPGKERSIALRHPWIFSGAIHSATGGIPPGSCVNVQDTKGQFLARAYYNPDSSLAARIIGFDPALQLDEALITQRLAEAWQRRARLRTEDSNMQRVVASEADLLPGLIVDRYRDWVVFQILTRGMELQREAIVAAIRKVIAPYGILERSDEAIREKEGLQLRKDLVQGELPEEGMIGVEHGLRIGFDMWEGHKTGFYLDQRTNRQIVGQYAAGAEVLNCFSYTGGFSCAAGKGGARHVISVDESRAALDYAERNWSLNGLSSDSHETVRADVFAYLRELRAQSRQFDVIILDPPKFVSDKQHLDRACRGYKDLNLLALQLLRPGGYLATFSCSGLIPRDLFQKVVFGAASDAQTEVHILHHLSQSDDHPVLLSFPESLYLKGLLCQKLS
jgi:23S rRNA (cytosine1962-C5)-methyltransferase